MKTVTRLKAYTVGMTLLLGVHLTFTSSAAGPPPVITLQPQNQTVPLEGTATFTVEATSGTALTYQWYFEGSVIPGANESFYTRINVQFSHAGTYHVTVRNSGGRVTSSNAVLTVKNAPVLMGANNLSPVFPNDFTNGGTLVTQLILGQVTDPDLGALQGIAVTAVDNASGTWQYSTDSGTVWTDFGSPTASAARLLAANANTYVRLVPNTNFLGTVTDGLTFRAWDQTAGTAGGTADVTTNGGTTAFSASTAASSVTVGNYSLLIVDTTRDVADGTTASVTALLANKGADGKISLREGITAANNTPNGAGGPDRIWFAIPDPLVGGAHTINVSNALPVITDSVIINGATDDHYPERLPVIELDGVAAGAEVNGLTVAAHGCSVIGLAIDRFPANGLVLSGNSNRVQNSCFGTGVNAASDLGNGLAGILITGGGNTIGGGVFAQFNVIGGNTGAGILISNVTATGNRVFGNYIGLSADSLTLLTNAHGVRMENGASNNRLGGTGSGVANRIAASLGDGVSVVGASTTNNAFLGNLIQANVGLAIDLNDDGVTANDLGDGDTGPNGRQNFPVLSSATVNGSSLTVTGSLNTAASATYRIEFFRVSTGQADPTGYGESESFLGQVSVTTDGSGNATFNTILNGVVIGAGDQITATATRDFGGGLYGNTSEFAQNVTATFVGTPGFAIDVLSPLALGNELRVNTTTNGDQYVYYGSIRTVGMAPDGSFVQVWIDKGGLDGSLSGIYGQQFDLNGNKVGGEFLVNTTTLGDQDNVSLAMGRSGQFIVTWDSGGDIHGQRFLADGTRVGSEFLVNTTTQGTQRYPEVDFATNGSFMVAWTGPNPGGEGSATLFQRFDANGNKVGGEIVGNTFSGTSQILEALAIRDDGSFVVTWGSGGDVYGRLFDSNGVAITAAFLINTTTVDTQQNSDVRSDGAGNFIVVWESASQDGSGNGVFGRRFAADGTPLGGELAITTQTAGDQFGPTLAVDRFGTFVVAWTDGNALDGSAESVWLQRFDANGLRVGDPQRANQTTAGYQARPVIAMNNVGRVVVGWEGNGPGDNYGVYARRYQLNPVVTEGSNTTFTVALNTPPTAPVTLNLSVSDATEASLNTSSLTFAPANWNLAQSVIITGVQDRLVDGDVALTIITGAAASSDPAYNGLNPDDIPMITLDSGATNTAPVANNQSVTTLAATPKAIVLTGSDGDNDPLTFVIVTAPANGVISGFNTNTGALTYSPNGSDSGADSFTFQVNDGFASSGLATVNVTVTAAADVATTVTGPTGVFANTSFSYTVTVTNLGPSGATNLSVSDTLPAGVNFVSASSGGTPNAGVVTWPMLALLASGVATNFTLTVTAPAAGTLTNTVASTAVTSDPDSSNNDGTAATTSSITVIYDRPVLTGQWLPGGEFQLQFRTLPDTPVSIEASTNLVHWQTLVTTNSGSGLVVFIEQDTSSHPMRFYRSVQAP